MGVNTNVRNTLLLQGESRTRTLRYPDVPINLRLF